MTPIDTTRPAAPATRDSEPATVYSPSTDVIEFDDHMELLLDLPGVPADALEVKFEDDALSIHGRRAPAQAPSLLHQEYGAVEFRRAFTVPEGYDSTRIEASLDNCVLRLRLPKAESVKPRRIQVR